MPAEKSRLLRESFRWAVSQTVVCTKLLSTLVGLWIFGALLRRELLSVPHDIFKFIEQGDGERRRWWANARREAVAMGELVPMM